MSGCDRKRPFVTAALLPDRAKSGHSSCGVFGLVDALRSTQSCRGLWGGQRGKLSDGVVSDIIRWRTVIGLRDCTGETGAANTDVVCVPEGTDVANRRTRSSQHPLGDPA